MMEDAGLKDSLSHLLVTLVAIVAKPQTADGKKNHNGVKCRVEGCTYEYVPSAKTTLGKVLGPEPGKVDLSTLQFGKPGEFKPGDTLNNVSSFCGTTLHNIRTVLIKHYQNEHRQVDLPAYPEVLSETVDYWIENKPDKLIEVIELYY